jgi:hypothetical protein
MVFQFPLFVTVHEKSTVTAFTLYMYEQNCKRKSEAEREGVATADIWPTPLRAANQASAEPARWWPQAAIRSRDACWYSRRPSPADGEKALARRSRRGPRRDAGPFCKVGKSVRNSEMLGRFVCGFLAARADRHNLELRKRAQGRNVGIAPRPLRILAPMMPTRIFSVAIIILP